jgi:MSHA pilin protein MshA
MKNSLPKPNGFTLIELIVVIVILGIMAAVAGPKFVNLQSDARVSVMKGVEGSVRSAATLAYSKSLIEGEEGNASVSGVTSQVVMSGQVVETDFGYPAGAAAGIEVAIDASSDISFSHAAGVTTFSHTNKAACLFTYTEPTGANNSPTYNLAALTAANC